MNQKQHLESFFNKQSVEAQNEYRIRLTASLDVIRLLLNQGLSFRGDDESEESNNQGNFLVILTFLADNNEGINNCVLKNCPQNMKMTSPKIQKDLVNAAAVETVNVIIKDLGEDLFAILIDECRDISVKEQMAIVLRYVDKKGCVLEQLVGLVHVHDTTAVSLKKSLNQFFVKHQLSISKLRGQGYDGASNMRGEFNGLKTLIMRENKSAYYVHCFAHQLQLALVHVARDITDIASFFLTISIVVNTVGASCKRRDSLRDSRQATVIAQLNSGEIPSGKGLNQETSLSRPGDTHWGSHYGSLISLITMFSSVIDVLEDVEEDGLTSDQKGEANCMLENIQSFCFIFKLHLMKKILGITNDLSKTLQRKDQDIVNAMGLVNTCKSLLQKMRDQGWDSLLTDVSKFCEKHAILVPRMDEKFIALGRSRRKAQGITNDHYYCVELFYACIDKQLTELNFRFNEVNTQLLRCMTCLNPSKSFAAFNKDKLIDLARHYPDDFSEQKIMELNDQLDTYFMDVSSDDDFSYLNGIGELAKKMVQTRKDMVYPLVYLLIKLSLILPVATATVERAFSAIKIVKSPLRNRMGDDFVNDCLMTYVEKDIFDTIDNEAILTRFQSMKNRRGALPKAT